MANPTSVSAHILYLHRTVELKNKPFFRVSSGTPSWISGCWPSTSDKMGKGFWEMLSASSPQGSSHKSKLTQKSKFRYERSKYIYSTLVKLLFKGVLLCFVLIFKCLNMKKVCKLQSTKPLQRRLFSKSVRTVSELSVAPFTLGHFRFKSHKFYYGHAFKLRQHFRTTKMENFEDAANPILVWICRGCV